MTQNFRNEIYLEDKLNLKCKKNKLLLLDFGKKIKGSNKKFCVNVSVKFAV